MTGEESTSRRAKEWIDDMIRKHGRHYPDRIVIPLAQRELARREGLSPGTIAWYLEQLGDDVVERRPFIVVRPCSRRTPDVRADEQAPSPTPSIVAALVDLTDAVEAQCELLRLVLDELRPREGRAGDSRDRATGPRDQSRGGSRDSEKRDELAGPSPSLSPSSSREQRDRPARQSRDERALAELLAPIDDLVRRCHLVPVTNRRRLADALAPYDDEQLTAAVGRLLAFHRNGATVRSPFGLLISRAEAGDDDFFAATTAAKAESPEPELADDITQAAEAEVAALEADPHRWSEQLAEIDERAFADLHAAMPDRAARLLSLPQFRHDARVRVVGERLERTR